MRNLPNGGNVLSSALFRNTALALALAAAGAACGPVRTADQDLPADLAQTLRGILGDQTGDARYFAKAVDLDGDGRPEVVAHVAGPMVCGTGGCDTLVLAPEGQGLRLVTRMTVSRPPIVAAETRSNGWRDLVVRVSGGGIIPGYDALLQFDGVTYPDNPTVDPAKPLGAAVPGTVLIEPFESYTQGRPLGVEGR